jgi:hypothetical protein
MTVGFWLTVGTGSWVGSAVADGSAVAVGASVEVGLALVEQALPSKLRIAMITMKENTRWRDIESILL